MKLFASFLFIIGLCLAATYGQLPFKYDNKHLYKPVFLDDAFRLMASSADYLLLDVRSPGEFADTSHFTSLNIGRLKNSVNISIDSVEAHLEELKKYSGKNIFVYCSHSQRSRRVSKLLSENGFTNVFNINGGMSAVNESDFSSFPFKKQVFETRSQYSNIAGKDALNLITVQHDLVIIDIRNESEFTSRDSSIQKNIGRIVHAINIPNAVFKERFNALHVSKDQELLVYDQYGALSGKVAHDLTDMGYLRVFNLYEGLSGFLCNNITGSTSIKTVIEQFPIYHIIGVREGIDLLKKDHPIIIDARPVLQFTNHDSIVYKNLGHLNAAINIYSVEKLDSIVEKTPRGAIILIYGTGADNVEVGISNVLCERGFTNVHLLYQGLYRFVWSCFNLKECMEGVDFLTDHTDFY